MEQIRKEFPDDFNKAVRHELYQLIHSIPLNSKHPDSAAPDTTITNHNYKVLKTDLINFESLIRIEKVFAEERFGMCSLNEMVAATVKQFIVDNKTFSAYDVTKAIREKVNKSRLILLDDRYPEEIDLFGDGLTAIVQRIPHEEVKGAIQLLWASGDTFKGYRRSFINGHYEFHANVKKPNEKFEKSDFSESVLGPDPFAKSMGYDKTIPLGTKVLIENSGKTGTVCTPDDLVAAGLKFPLSIVTDEWVWILYDNDKSGIGYGHKSCNLKIIPATVDDKVQDSLKNLF